MNIHCVFRGACVLGATFALPGVSTSLSGHVNAAHLGWAAESTLAGRQICIKPQLRTIFLRKYLPPGTCRLNLLRRPLSQQRSESIRGPIELLLSKLVAKPNAR